MTREQVIGVMKGFTSALGVRCQHCHVARDPADFSTFDFASDEKETKKVARAMLTMTREINDTLLPRTGRTSLMRVQCVTCHRGVPRPESLADVLVATAEKSGVEAAQRQYQELREKHGTTGGYDFSLRSLGAAATRLAEAGRVDDAIRLHEFSLTVLPPSATTYVTLADLYVKKGDRAAARGQIEKALLLQPEDANLKKRLQELGPVTP
jgi:tetratricopeptide (TPR) repeat protein